jgi:hypothetical protein
MLKINCCYNFNYSSNTTFIKNVYDMFGIFKSRIKMFTSWCIVTHLSMEFETMEYINCKGLQFENFWVLFSCEYCKWIIPNK